MASSDADLVAKAQGHALGVHGTEVPADLVLALARPLRKKAKDQPPAL